MSDPDAITVPNLQTRISVGWDELHTFLGTLSDEQLTKPTDAAGWTVKDHLVHLAVWEDGICGVFEGKSFPEAMGVDAETWKTGGDAPNAAIQKRYCQVSLDEAREMSNRCHENLLAAVNTLADDDLMRPYCHFLPASDDQQLIISLLVGNTFGHYAEHIPWMKAIAESDGG